MKKDRGSISIITLATVLFMIAFLISTYAIIANRRQAQAEIKMETKEIYEKDIARMDEVYEEYFADEDEEIPIYTAEQLLKIGTNELIAGNNKIYKCTPEANYKLMDNLAFAVVDYVEEYPDAFEDKEYTKTITETETFTNQTTSYSTVANSTYTAPGKGTYILQVWGAQGGSYNSSYAAGGKGGYSIGTITLEQDDKLYVHIGGQGSYGTDTNVTAVGGGGANGGGSAGYRGGGGGGGTDIRIGGDTLYNRVIVAGGGGGAYAYNKTYKAVGGAGGGTSGIAGGYYSSSYSTFIGSGGTQTSGGAKGTGSSTNYNGKDGEFGAGGNTGYKYNNTSYYSNGAGRRWLVWRWWSWKL